MNTIRSVGYGWGVLIVAGGGAYWMAKRSISVDREARAQLELQRRQLQQKLREQDRMLQETRSASRREAREGSGADPSHEASQDPAPISHAPSTDRESLHEKSKYEASETWRSRKGDRLG